MLQSVSNQDASKLSSMTYKDQSQISLLIISHVWLRTDQALCPGV